MRCLDFARADHKLSRVECFGITSGRLCLYAAQGKQTPQRFHLKEIFLMLRRILLQKDLEFLIDMTAVEGHQ